MGKMRIVGMAEARPKLTQLVNEVSEGGDPYFIVANSKVKAVLVGIEQYNDMMEQMEDINTPTGTSVVP
jgi:prevent-host-death family protein